MLQSNAPIPLLFFGDAPDSPTGLGRIGHDLAWIASSMPEFKVGYLGRGAFGRCRFPWASYSFGPQEQWGECRLQEAWEDLAGDREGIIMTVWDASRLLWFVNRQDPFLGSGRFRRFGYFMADGAGVNPNTLPQEQAHVVSQYDRVLMASQWAHSLVQAAGPDLDWLPHPINKAVFTRGGGAGVRSVWGVGEGEPLIGCVMTNQQRKHWPVVLEAVALLIESYPNLHLWMHTDAAVGYWNLQALVVEYGLTKAVISEGRALSDTELAMRYSACDVTVVISGGEGFCYPVAESLACGTPAVTGRYGAQAELTPWLVPPAMTVVDTSHNVRRAVYHAVDVANELARVIEARPRPEVCEELVTHLGMMKLGKLWKKWFRRGLEC